MAALHGMRVETRSSIAEPVIDATPGTTGRHLVVTVHGIRTYGEWQERLESQIHDVAPNVTVCHYKYGYFSCIAFMIPVLRWLVTLRFRRALLSLIAEDNWQRVDIVAHSFGTHLTGWGLYGIPPAKRPKIHTIILAGSVLKPGFPWYHLRSTCVGRVANECGIHDEVLVLNQAVVLFTGMAGRIGFAGMNDEHFRNRYFAFGHSGCFMRRDRPYSKFMRRRWVPLLLNEGQIPPEKDPRRPTPLGGVIAFLVNNMEPLKICIYLSPFIFLSILFLSLYEQADLQRGIAKKETQVAREQQHIAEDKTREARDRLLALEIASGQRRVEEGEMASALPFYVLAMLSDSSDPVRQRDHRVRIGTTIRQCPALQQVLFPKNWEAGQAIFSPDGTRVALAGGTILTGSGAQIWDITKAKVIATFCSHENAETSLAFSPDGRLVATSSDDETVRVWNAQTGKLVLPSLKHSDHVSFVSFDSTGDRLLTVAGSRARIWDARTGAPLIPYMAQNAAIDHAAFSSDGTRVISISEDQTAQIWDAATGKPMCPPLATGALPGWIGAKLWADFSPNGSKAVTTNGDTVRIWNAKTGVAITGPLNFVVASFVKFVDDDTVLGVNNEGGTQFWNANTGETQQDVRRHGGEEDIKSFSLTPDCQQIAIGKSDGTVRIWDTKSEDPLTCLLHQSEGVECLQFSPDATKLLTLGQDQIVRIWDLDVQPARIIEQESPNSIESASLSPSAQQIVSVVESSNSAPVFDVKSGKLQFLLTHDDEVKFATFSPSGDRIVTLGKDSTARVWNAQTGEAVFNPIHLDKPPTTAAFSRDGRLLAIGTSDESDHGTAGIWDVGTGRAISPVIEHASVERLIFHPNGKSILIAGGVAAWLYDLQTGERITGEIRQCERGLMDADLSHDGRRIITGSLDGVAQVWDALSGKPLTLPMVHSEYSDDMNFRRKIHHCGFSPDDHSVFTTSDDGTARLWNSATGQPLAPALKGATQNAAFSPDGHWILTGGSDGSAQIWTADTGVAITPPLMHGELVSSVSFSPDCSSVLTASWDGTVRLWDVSEDTRPLDTLQQWAELISCQKIDATGDLVTLTPDEFERIWRQAHYQSPTTTAAVGSPASN